ncbi:undecaprenyl phosphate translocase family protein [Alkalicoccus luteus]|uniref:undecaprenyl phosphate translocase family protein n=1 Tax=Alkalicoccus luteus TaxID=1237094 RepID=UPI004033D50F
MRLIASLSMLSTKDRQKAIPFLAIFGFGMVTGLLGAMWTIDHLLQTYRTPTLLFFAGIITGFLPGLVKETAAMGKGIRVKEAGWIFAGIAAVIVLQAAGGRITFETEGSAWVHYLFLGSAGLAASTALVLPGMSGALILTILGVYETATAAVLQLNFSVLLPISAGVITGLLVISRLVKAALTNHPFRTYLLITGLVTGSLYALGVNLEASAPAVWVASGVTFTAGAAGMLFIANLSLTRT